MCTVIKHSKYSLTISSLSMIYKPYHVTDDMADMAEQLSYLQMNKRLSKSLLKNVY